MIQKEHHIIISLASNINHEANLEAARTQLTQLLSEVHFTSAIYTEPVGNCQLSMVNVPNILISCAKAPLPWV